MHPVLAYAICKIGAVAGVILGAYVAQRDMSERFIRRVYLQKKPPPSLVSMVSTVMLMYGVLVAACLTAVLFTMHVKAQRPDVLGLIAVRAIVDLACFAFFAIVIGVSMARNIGNQIYFNYKLEGLRAVRAMRRMLVGSLAPIAALPVAMLISGKFMLGVGDGLSKLFA